MTFLDALILEYIDGTHWRLVTAFDYKPKYGAVITVPANFHTDFASVPRMLWVWLPPTGQYGKAAVIHDFLYTSPARRTRAECDALFVEAMTDLGVAPLRRKVMWLGVRLGGWFPWRRYRKQ